MTMKWSELNQIITLLKFNYNLEIIYDLNIASNNRVLTPYSMHS